MIDYNGWANYQTWNVALWINNDAALYRLARMYRNRGYADFAYAILHSGFDGEIAKQTPDGVAWNDSDLDINALDEMLEDL